MSEASPSSAPPSLEELASFANSLADEARRAILPYWRRPIDVESKTEPNRPITESPVTIADRAAEEAMRRMIEGQYPDHGILGEEHGEVRMDASHVWVLDPIDGTKLFINGKPLFGTLIACLKDGEPVIGIIDQCVLDERWLGIKGRGTTLNGRPVRTAGRSRLSEAMLCASTPHMFREGEESEKFDRMRTVTKRTTYGADCYAYAIVASGFGADVVVEADLGLYDYCALVPVVEGAGGVMTDWGGRKLTLGNHGKCGGRVVACANVGLHAEAMVILGDGRSPTGRWLSVLIKNGLLHLAVGVVIGMALSRPIK